MTPLEALEAFWKKVTVSAPFLPGAARSYASFLGNPHFFMPRQDYMNIFGWTYFYEIEPLRRTLEELVDLDALADKTAFPRLLVSATDLKQGEIKYFYSDDAGYKLSLDHIIASGSLPLAFPAAEIGHAYYWDGGLFDNTPLGAVLDHLNDARGVNRTVYVVNLFPNKAKIPTNMMEIAARMKNLQFANKSREDMRLLDRFNDVAALIEALEALPQGNPLEDHDAYKRVKAEHYIQVPRIVPITQLDVPEQFGDADFSPEAIEKRAEAGERQAREELERPHKRWPSPAAAGARR